METTARTGDESGVDELTPPKWLLRWQPIETAPKDGTHILIYVPAIDDGADEILEPALIYVCRWVSFPGLPPAGEWREAGGEDWATFDPTHWMRLPEPPQ